MVIPGVSLNSASLVVHGVFGSSRSVRRASRMLDSSECECDPRFTPLRSGPLCLLGGPPRRRFDYDRHYPGIVDRQGRRSDGKVEPYEKLKVSEYFPQKARAMRWPRRENKICMKHKANWLGVEEQMERSRVGSTLGHGVIRKPVGPDEARGEKLDPLRRCRRRRMHASKELFSFQFTNRVQQSRPCPWPLGELCSCST